MLISQVNTFEELLVTSVRCTYLVHLKQCRVDNGCQSGGKFTKCHLGLPSTVFLGCTIFYHLVMFFAVLLASTKLRCHFFNVAFQFIFFLVLLRFSYSQLGIFFIFTHAASLWITLNAFPNSRSARHISFSLAVVSTISLFINPACFRNIETYKHNGIVYNEECFLVWMNVVFIKIVTENVKY